MTLYFPWNPWGHEYEHWTCPQDWDKGSQQMKTSLRAQGATSSYAGTLHLLVGNSSFHLVEKGKQEKNSHSCTALYSYTQMTVTKLRQWIAGSLGLLYWDPDPAKGSLYVCFNYHVFLKMVTVYADFLQCLTLFPSLCLRYLNFVFPTGEWN